VSAFPDISSSRPYDEAARRCRIDGSGRSADDWPSLAVISSSLTPFMGWQYMLAQGLSLWWKTSRWGVLSGASCSLSDLPLRLLNTTANSVAFEQSFSVQNIQVTKLRNRLTVEYAEQLIFIYINSRVLAKTVYNTVSPREVELHEIEAENDVLPGCAVAVF
jgi:hypothetical protein